MRFAPWQYSLPPTVFIILQVYQSEQLMDESVKTLVAEAFPDLAHALFGHAFNLEDACGGVAAYMFRRYGVSNYQCSAAVRDALTSQLDAEPRLQRSATGEDPAWEPSS
jgi:hypothetical protein